MEKPSLLQNPSVGEILAVRGSGQQGGRPSEEVVVVDMVEGLECPGSEIPVGFQPVQKKGRTWDDAVIPEDVTMEVAEAVSLEKAGVVLGVGGAVEDHRSAAGPSFKDNLLESTRGSKVGPSLGDLDVEILTVDMEEVEPVVPVSLSVGEENERDKALAKGDVVGVILGSSDDGIEVSDICPNRPV
ncbi:hypothetical protein V6N13_080929 [Hibiscus sabdariffa]